MLRIFLFGVISVIASSTFAQEPADENCVSALLGGETTPKAKHVLECIQEVEVAQKEKLSQIQNLLKEEISKGDADVVGDMREILAEIDPDKANESLSKNFDQRAVVSQIQAQASCAAISFAKNSFRVWIRAVFRPHVTPFGNPASGNGDTITCDAICSSLEAPSSSSRPEGSCIAALHVYGELAPFITGEADFTSVGDRQVFTRSPSASLMTHVYEPVNGCGHTHFGPNYCCCSN